jgi:uncharacterized protein YhfF
MNSNAHYRELPRWSFGDSPALADELLALVLNGTKTATCGPLREYHAEGVPLPKVGERSVLLDGTGKASCVIEVTEVAIRHFADIDEAFAHDEGEASRTLDDWRRIHEEFFRRHGDVSDDLELVCERFRLVEVLPKVKAS